MVVWLFVFHRILFREFFLSSPQTGSIVSSIYAAAVFNCTWVSVSPYRRDDWGEAEVLTTLPACHPESWTCFPDSLIQKESYSHKLKTCPVASTAVPGQGTSHCTKQSNRLLEQRGENFLEVAADVAHTGGLGFAPLSSFMLLTDSQFNFLKKPEIKAQQCWLPNHLGWHRLSICFSWQQQLWQHIFVFYIFLLLCLTEQ